MTLVDPRELRPGRGWYWVAGLVVLATVVIGVALFVVGIVTATNTAPNIGDTFTNGETVQVQLAAGEEKGIFVSSESPRATLCTSNDAYVSMRPASFTFTQDGREWAYFQKIKASTAGTYELRCGEVTDPSEPNALYAVAPAPELGGFFGGLFGGLAAFFGLPCLGVVLAAIIALITGVRRSSHKNRLLRERRGY